MMMINGIAYGKGLGVLAESSGNTIVYNLNKEYSRFTADIGLDDASKGMGSVEFKILADNVEIYNSGIIKGKDVPTKSIDINVAGASELKLVVLGVGDSSQNDYAAWGNAMLHKGISVQDETVESVAVSINSTSEIEKDSKHLVLPQVPKGFSIKLTDISDPSLVSTDGTIVPTSEDTVIGLVFEITKLSDGSKAITKYITTTIPAKTADTAIFVAKI